MRLLTQILPWTALPYLLLPAKSGNLLQAGKTPCQLGKDQLALNEEHPGDLVNKVSIGQRQGLIRSSSILSQPISLLYCLGLSRKTQIAIR